MKIILATGNKNKVKEIADQLPSSIEVLSLNDIGYNQEIPEDHLLIEDNSLQKARIIWEATHISTLAEDTGLFVDALNGEPGVFSARYAGAQKCDLDNIQKVLNLLDNNENRKAHFKTVFTLIFQDKAYQFTGILEGNITKKLRGDHGFGYDPIFELPSGQTLAEIALEEKKKISHRAIALRQVINFLKQNSSYLYKWRKSLQ